MRTIHHVLDVDAPLGTVWNALTEPDQLAQWWSTRLEMDGPTVGGHIRFTFVGDFNPVMEITEITEITDRRALQWRCVDGHQNWQDNTFAFEVVPLNEGRTRLRFTQNYAVELDDDDYGVYNFNWGYYLESLRRLCTTGAGQPFVVPTG